MRKAIFVAIMGADDFVHAFDRVTKLKLKKAQRAEVVRVLMHCCGAEVRMPDNIKRLIFDYFSSPQDTLIHAAHTLIHTLVHTRIHTLIYTLIPTLFTPHSHPGHLPCQGASHHPEPYPPPPPCNEGVAQRLLHALIQTASTPPSTHPSYKRCRTTPLSTFNHTYSI